MVRLFTTFFLTIFWGIAGEASAQPRFDAEGHANPTLAFNAGPIADYVQSLQFLDIAKSMRPWVGHKKGQWGGMEYEELLAGGYIDDDGWVRSIPEGLQRVGTIWQWAHQPEFAHHRKGRYILTYKGEGTLNLGGDVRVIQRSPGRILFENRKGENMFLSLRDLDPKGTGNYIRNISIIAEKYVDLFAVGGRFNPEWLKLVEDARVLRFMSWNRTNSSTVRSWDERATPDQRFTKRGVPVEYMVQLANEVGADPWFTMPHLADREYIRNFAQYVRDHLDPELVVRVEYSNETWNFAFRQTHWLFAEAKSAGWGEAYHNYYTKKATETAMIWDDVFGAQAETRLRHVIGTQAVNTWATQQRLEAKIWRQKERNAYLAPAEVFDELAVTHYFGSPTVSDPELRAELLAKIKAPNVNAQAWLAKRLIDPSYEGSITAWKVFWRDQAALAHNHDMKLVAYEGGQHVHHYFAVTDIPKADVETLTNFMIEFVRSKHMADLYRSSWQAWAEVSDGPFMQFEEIGPVSKWGSWGLRSSLDDTSPRAALIDRLNARSKPWWETSGGLRYQHGVIRTGSDTADTLRGTLQEDYLIGSGGDDILQPGPGNDGVHGGEGHDRVKLSGALSDYVVRAIGPQLEVSGPDGRDTLMSIEVLVFENGSSVDVAELMLQPDGTLHPPRE